MRRRSDERRRAPRFRLALPIRFDDAEAGVSRDLSANGIFVHTDQLRPLSSSVRLSMVLGEWDASGGFVVRGDARVVRLETAGPRSGLALMVVWTDIDSRSTVCSERLPCDV